MATVTKLDMKFLDSNGKKISQNYKYVDPEVTDAKVKSLMECIVANGEIFAQQPVALESANIITTETTAVDLS